MPVIIHYTDCPICASADIGEVLIATDHTVSQERFPVWECRACSVRFTQDVPDKDSIRPYYRSDEYISHTNTDKGIINRLYLTVRKRTLKKKKDLILSATGKLHGKLLDVGSGTGAFVKEMKDAGWEVTGLEPDEGARKVAVDVNDVSLDESKVLFELPAQSVDVITLWHVLEHVHDLHDYMKQFLKLLRNKGKLMIAVPNHTSEDAKIFGEYWAAYDVPRHLYHFSPGSMKKLFDIHGFRLIEMKAMWYDSFYISMLSSKYKTGKTMPASSFIKGLNSNLKAWKDVSRCSSIIYIAEAV